MYSVLPDSLFRRRHAYDAIHNTISRARSTLERGGYGRVITCTHFITRVVLLTFFFQACYLAEKSINDVLDTGDNAAFLLSLHSSPKEAHQLEIESASAQPIATQ